MTNYLTCSMSEPTSHEVNERFLDFLMGNSKREKEAADSAAAYIRSRLQDDELISNLLISNLLPPHISDQLLADPKSNEGRLSYIFNE